MAKFVLIERQLVSTGGHYLQYAIDVLEAAEVTGYRPVLVGRREFSAKAQVPVGWQVHTVFQYGWARRYLLGVDGKSKIAIGTDGRPLPDADKSKFIKFLRNLCDLPRRIDRERQIEDFSQSCDTVFHEIGFNSEDCVFIPMFSEFDLLGLVRFLVRNPDSVALHLHLQFQMDIFHGREPDYASQLRMTDLLRRQFSSALAQIPNHRIHFYATTPGVAAQYNILEVAPFEPLPGGGAGGVLAIVRHVPISGQLFDGSRSNSKLAAERNSPLRITCAGSMRREKGKGGLSLVVERMAEFLAKKEVQFWVQTSPRVIKRYLKPRWTKNLQVHDKIPKLADGPIVALTDSLSREDYIQLISHSDIGLFLYDSQRYHARCSGPLIEMLASGIPVIVPAGTWLSHQIQEPIYEHLNSLCEKTPPSWVCKQNDMDMISSAFSKKISGRIEFGGYSKAVTIELPVASKTESILCSFRMSENQVQSHFIRIELQLLDRCGELVGEIYSSILDQKSETETMAAMFRVEATAEKARLIIHNAYHTEPIGIKEIKVAGFKESHKGLPAGQVGLISADLCQVPRLLTEMIEGYDHYRNTAAAFAKSWFEKNSPLRTIETLQANQHTDSSTSKGLRSTHMTTNL